MSDFKFTIVAFFAFALIAISLWVFQSKMEASAFNSVTGKSVSTWDAMWIQLRVQEQSK